MLKKTISENIHSKKSTQELNTYTSYVGQTKN